MANASDLKSLAQKAYGFKSHRSHLQSPSRARGLFRLRVPTNPPIDVIYVIRVYYA